VAHAKVIRAVLFDYGGVICFHPVPHSYQAAAQDSGLSLEDFVLAFWQHRIPYDAGKLSPEEYWRLVLTSRGAAFDPARVAIMTRHEISFWINMDRRILDWSNQLRAQGVRTGILSNMPSPLGEHLRAMPEFVNHFDHITFSFEMGGVKPDAQIYHDALAGVGAVAAETLFLDDRSENVAGAHAIGMHAELFENWEKFADGGPARYGLPVPVLATARRQ
jgi:putative hydrolase of the HAD superfamily